MGGGGGGVSLSGAVPHPDDVSHDAALLGRLHGAAVGGVAVGDDDEDAAGAGPGAVLCCEGLLPAGRGGGHVTVARGHVTDGAVT